MLQSLPHGGHPGQAVCVVLFLGPGWWHLHDFCTAQFGRLAQPELQREACLLPGLLPRMHSCYMCCTTTHDPRVGCKSGKLRLCY